MTLIDTIKNSPNQTLTFVLDNGDKVDVVLTYIENNLGWYISLTYGDDFAINNFRMVTSPNILRQYKDIIPFGIGVATADGYEPIALDDFSSGKAIVYLLNEDDMIAIDASIAQNNEK